MTDIIDLKFARLTFDLDTFVETNIVPDSFRDGTFTVNQLVNEYQHQLDEFRQGVLGKLLEELQKNNDQEASSLRSSLKAEYAIVMNNLKTADQKFMFPAVLHKYRAGINPVRAIYYEGIQVQKLFDRNNLHHLWLVDYITNSESNQEILAAIDEDLASLGEIIGKYYNHPLITSGNNLPVELFHAVYTAEDYRVYRVFFESASEWGFDQLG